MGRREEVLAGFEGLVRVSVVSDVGFVQVSLMCLSTV